MVCTAMYAARPIWPGYSMPFASRRTRSDASNPDVPDRHTQLEDLLSHVRRCEKWARFDDRLDLQARLEGRG
jgi:hypothetical protein